jgi:hypothetical protein
MRIRVVPAETMDLPIFFWRKHAATASAKAVRAVSCEECGTDYVYEVERAAVGHGLSIYALDEDGAARRAQEEARTEVQRRLESEIEVVPCPKCGRVQSHMVPLARRAYLRWVDTAGWVVLLLAFAVACLNVAMDSGAPPRRLLFAWPWVAAALAVGPVLIVLRLALAAAHDPNSTDPAARAALGQARALAPEEYERRRREGGRESPPPTTTSRSDGVLL